MLLRNPCKNLKSYDNPFRKNSDGGRGKRKEKERRREKFNDYSGTIVSERRRWRTHTLGPKWRFLEDEIQVGVPDSLESLVTSLTNFFWAVIVVKKVGGPK